MLSFLLSSYSLSAQHQGTFKFEGFFNGTNLNIQCRTAYNKPWYRCKCIDSVKVNGQIVDDIVYDGLQLDIANKVDLNLYDEVSVIIYFQKPCEIRTLNSFEFYPKTILPVTNLKVNDKNIMTFDVQQNYPDLNFWVQIEQKKWDEWVKVGSNITITNNKSYSFDLSPHLINGENEFRATMATITQERYPSKSFVIQAKVKKIKFKYKPKDKMIYFSDTTHFQLWDEQSYISNKGKSNQCAVDKLAPGKYLLQYGNREKWITLK